MTDEGRATMTGEERDRADMVDLLEDTMTMVADGRIKALTFLAMTAEGATISASIGFEPRELVYHCDRLRYSLHKQIDEIHRRDLEEDRAKAEGWEEPSD